MIEWSATLSELVVKVAVLWPLCVASVPLPITVDPSLNVTFPVGAVAPTVVTVAVKVTDWPKTELPLVDELTVVVVAGRASTVWLTAADVEAVKSVVVA